MVEHKALGMVGTLELPSGVDKMDGEIKWSSFYADALIQVANPYANINIGGLPIVEFDPMANIYKVAGNDVLAQFRANVGS